MCFNFLRHGFRRCVPQCRDRRLDAPWVTKEIAQVLAHRTKKYFTGRIKLGKPCRCAESRKGFLPAMQFSIPPSAMYGAEIAQFFVKIAQEFFENWQNFFRSR